ncbi:hypothetical protein Pcinc_022502 [Petrolisthes cinctipes]|uniref:PUM-HD domain-containing protein n=1 Tax=Petrolisthes cinctipes TaxID=88211 RepID=A0AAE1FG63_PETCI|nr:hypothetical protein Pcinc_022502 [Petrolisthes cinctipes]
MYTGGRNNDAAPLETVDADPLEVEKLLNRYDEKGRKRQISDEADSNEKPDWKKVKADRKELKVKHKVKSAGSTEKYELGVRAKKIWEELRERKCTKARKQELCKELLPLVRGKIKMLIDAHDTVRVIETLLAVGGEEHRTPIFEEIKDNLVSMSKRKYSRHFVVKILKYGNKDQKKFAINSLKGQVVKLMSHKIACEVVELAYNDYANASQRSMMVQEFYGPQFRLFHEDDIKCLDDVLKKYPEKKEIILKDLHRALQPIITKGVFTNTMVHTLIRDFLIHSSTGDRTAIIESLRENLVPIIHTRDGARVAMLCLWHGTGKDRKVIIKSLRTHMVKTAKEEHGHMVLLAAFDCVDDTVFLKKVILAELFEELDELVGSDYGLRILRYLVAPRSPTFFHPCIISVLAQGDGNEHSLKDTNIRQRELQEYSSMHILRLLMSNITDWAVNPNWTLFIGAAVKTLDSRERDSIFYKLAEMLGEPYTAGTGHPLEVGHTNKMLTYIIKCDPERDQAGKATLCSIILKVVKEEEIVGWVNSNRGCFLLANMIETGLDGVSLNLKKLLTPYKEKLGNFNFKGAEVLLKNLECSEEQK